MDFNTVKSKPKNGINLTAEDPVKWHFEFKKISFNKYQFRAMVVIEKGWRFYSRESPKEGALPTAITFEKDILLYPLGGLKEQGDMKVHNDKNNHIKTCYYLDTVEYIV